MLTRVRLGLIFDDFVHYGENFIPPYIEKIKKEIKGASALLSQRIPCCYGDAVIIKLNILGTLLIKKPICPVRFIKNPSGGIKKLSRARGDDASNIFQGGFAFFVLVCIPSPSSSSTEKILDRNIPQYRPPVDDKRLSFRLKEELSRAEGRCKYSDRRVYIYIPWLRHQRN